MKKKETKTREYERKVTIATEAVCDFLREEKNTSFGAMDEGRLARVTDYIHAAISVWSELKVKVRLYDFTRTWIARDYSEVISAKPIIKVLVGVPYSDCKSVTFEY